MKRIAPLLLLLPAFALGQEVFPTKSAPGATNPTCVADPTACFRYSDANAVRSDLLTRLRWRGAYSGVTAYYISDVVSNGGEVYVATADSTGSAPPSANWTLIASGATTGAVLQLGDGSGGHAGYAGTSCTNQFPRSLSTAGAATCASVAVADLSATGTPSGSTFLRGDGQWGTPAGYSGTVSKLAAAVNNSTTTPANAITISIGSTGAYGFMCVLNGLGTATGGIRYNVNGPTATNVSFETRRFTTTSAQTLLVLQAFSASAQTATCTSSCNTTNLTTTIHGSFTATATGTFALMITSSTAAQQVTLQPGSYCVVY